MKIERRFLTSRVARRVFILFVLCAFLPVSVFAVFSYVQVRGELRRTADEALRQSTKMTGLSILERLLFLKGDLARYAMDLEATPDVGDVALIGQTRDRFERVWTLDPSQPQDPVVSGIDLGTLDPSQRKRLGRGTLLLTPHQDDEAQIVLIQPIAHSSRVLVGVVRPKYLWSGEEFFVGSHHFAVLGDQRAPVFSSPLGRVALASQPPDVDNSTGAFRWSHDGRNYAGSHWTLFMEHEFATQWIIVQSQESEVAFAALESFNTVFVLVVLLSLLVVALLSSTQIRQQLVPITKLINATRQLRARDFSARVSLDTNDEFGELGQSFDHMAADLEHHIDIVKTSNTIGTLLSAEVDDRSLLQTVLVGVRRVTNADGAAVYLLNDDRELELARVDVDSLQLRSWDPEDMPTPSAYTSRPWEQSHDSENALIPNDLKVSPQERAELDRFETRYDYRVRSWLPVALRNHEKQLIGYLQVFNKRGVTDGSGFSADDEEVVGSLASQAAVAITKNRLVNVFQTMFEGLTNLIAVAVDAKSPYTGRHCQRVPVLAMMLADAACKTKSGPLQDFELSNAELYELKIAALLHDCGKVTTPVHVIDKATKLETIFDRVDLIATRFQVLKSQQGEATHDAKQMAQIDDDLEFLMRCNKGREWMPKEDQERVRQIAQRYRWTTPTGEVAPILTDDEVENLCIARGTLNHAEREIINDHVVATIKMLETLPYPRSLRAVPELAGAHHEKLDGSGYPRGLKSARLSMRARILAFADIFEALTAKDRPYKDGKKLSEVMRILETMTREGQLDPDVLDVLVREGVYLRYAEEYLDPEQVDETRFDHLVTRDGVTTHENEGIPEAPSTA